MLINFITDKNDATLLEGVEKLFDGFAIKYKSGVFKKNIVHYMEYKCIPANINIFYGYINNLLIDYSKNNIFIYDQIHFSQAWVPQLHCYDMILVKSKKDKIIDSFIKRDTSVIEWDTPNINEYYASIMKVCSKIKSIRLPDINNFLDIDDLPPISICIPTYNRRKFMPLLKLNYENTSYPKDKIEMIVIDDGNDNILNALPEGENIKHFKYDKKECIGRKRNICVEKATNDIIVFWDDDDYYPADSLINRVGNLLKSNKDCVFCSSIGCFHIQKLSSIINISPTQYSLEKKVSESTLTFKKSFWKDKEFKYTDRLNEGEYFIEGRVDKCKEISWEGVIVQLLHSYNTNSKNIKIDEKNGSHFGFSDEEFKLIKNL